MTVEPGSGTPPRATSTRSVTSSGGVAVRLHDFGGQGSRVFAAHATGFNGLVWRPLARALTAAHVVAPDLRAHGGSPVPPDSDLHWDRFADDVLVGVDALGWGEGPRPVGIGHSMGGAALLTAELARPGTFAGLWVYEPIIFPPEVRELASSRENPLAVGARRRRPVFASRQEARETYASKPPMNTFDGDALAGYVEAGFVDEPDGSVHLACAPDDEARIYTLASTCTAFERLGAVRCPVVVVRGAMLDASPAGIAAPAAEALVEGRLVVHDELSHFGPMEDPVGLAAEIDAFVDEVTGGAEGAG